MNNLLDVAASLTNIMLCFFFTYPLQYYCNGSIFDRILESICSAKAHNLFGKPIFIGNRILTALCIKIYRCILFTKKNMSLFTTGDLQP